MHLIQISDLHIGTADELPFEVDVRANFLKMLRSIQQENYDLLVISGDLCYDEGDPAIYIWIKAQLEAENIPYVVLSGNHDDTNLLAEAFGLNEYNQHGQLYYAGKEEEPPLLFLDSGCGRIQAHQLSYIDNYLRKHQQPITIFMHHPPLPMGVPYMDNNHALQNGAELVALLTAHSYPVHIFTGHYHVDKSLQHKNLSIYITPSTFFQIDWRANDFLVHHHRCAYRSIQWDGDRLETGLFWI